MAKVINEKDVTISKSRNKLGFAELSPERLKKITLFEQTITRRGRESKHSMPSKVSQNILDDTNDKELEKKRLEKEEAVTLNEKWKGQMDYN